MANKKRGYVTIRLDKSRNLLFNFNAICELEEEIGRPITHLQDSNIGFREIRALLWAGLRHEDPSLTIEDAGNLINEAESIQYVTETVVEALALGLGTKQGEESGNGQKGKRGTGTS